MEEDFWHNNKNKIFISKIWKINSQSLKNRQASRDNLMLIFSRKIRHDFYYLTKQFINMALIWSKVEVKLLFFRLLTFL